MKDGVEWGYRYKRLNRAGGKPGRQFEVPAPDLATAQERVGEYTGEKDWEAAVVWREPGSPPGPWRDYVPEGAREDVRMASYSPQVLSDLLSLTEAGIIPPGVIATWTMSERERAAAWAAAEHLHASDNDDVPRSPVPGCVMEAAELAASPAMAQLAVESWTAHLEAVERSRRPISSDLSNVLEAGRRAITGLLILAEAAGQRGGWHARATTVLAEHPEGMSTADLMMLLGTGGPSREALEAWLGAGEAEGRIEHPGYATWRLRGVRL